MKQEFEVIIVTKPCTGPRGMAGQEDSFTPLGCIRNNPLTKERPSYPTPSLVSIPGPSPRRLQRLVLSGLGRTILSEGRETWRLSQTLLKRLQCCRNRLNILPHTLPANGGQLAESNSGSLSIHRQVSEEDNPRVKTARQLRATRTLLQIYLGAERETRPLTNPASTIVQLQEGQGSPENLCWADRSEVQACDRVQKQVLVQTRDLQATRKQECSAGLVGEPVRVYPTRSNL